MRKTTGRKMMAKFFVRVTGTAVVWKDVPVEADSAEEALAKVDDGDVPDIAEQDPPWEFSEGGNGVDDWSSTGEVMDADRDPVMEDGEVLESEGING
jgi:hypothetical protein